MDRRSVLRNLKKQIRGMDGKVMKEEEGEERTVITCAFEKDKAPILYKIHLPVHWEGFERDEGDRWMVTVILRWDLLIAGGIHGH